MRVGLGAWLGQMRGLAAALGEVFAAEREMLRRDLERSAARLKSAMILLAVAAFFLAAAGVALVLSCYHGLSLILDPWAAALVLALILGLVAVVLLLVMRAQLRRLESPVHTMRRRVREHRRWWHKRIFSSSTAADPAADSGDAAP